LLAGDAAAVDTGDDVEAALEVEQREGRVHHLLVELVGEVVLQRAAVDAPLAGPGDESDARNRFLAATERLARGGDALTAARRGGLGLRGVAEIGRAHV